MRIYFDANNFVWEAVNISTPEVPNSTNIVKQGHKFTSPLIDIQYYLPRFKIVNNEVIEITDPIDYYTSPVLWERYNKKLLAEMNQLVRTRTDDQLKAIYDASPAYKQEAIYNAIHYSGAEKLPQFDMNLTLEIMCRLLAEWLYITNVEQRVLTTDETTAVHNILTTLHNHNSMLKLNVFDPNSPILDPLAWPQYYIPNMMNISDQIRSVIIPRTLYVCGR